MGWEPQKWLILKERELTPLDTKALNVYMDYLKFYPTGKHMKRKHFKYKFTFNSNLHNFFPIKYITEDIYYIYIYILYIYIIDMNTYIYIYIYNRYEYIYIYIYIYIRLKTQTYRRQYLNLWLSTMPCYYFIVLLFPKSLSTNLLLRKQIFFKFYFETLGCYIEDVIFSVLVRFFYFKRVLNINVSFSCLIGRITF